jgi:pimeloyl-ACP methyl ester carboxylesterase
MRTVLAVIVGLASCVRASNPVFEVSFDAALRDSPASGRLVVYVISDKSAGKQEASPADAPFADDPQPMFGIDVKDLAPGAVARVGDDATSYPLPLSKLPAGGYRVQVVLDMHQDDSLWKREPGNLFSETTSVHLNEAGAPERISIKLTKVVKPRVARDVPGVELFEMKSKLLSDFHHRDIVMHAGVAFPKGFDAKSGRKYAAVYEVPGFGSDHFGAYHPMRGPAVAEHCFWIVLNPESGNGHTLFADSANNGPCGKALVEELIPALEAKYPLIPKTSARLLRGHSSGGWSTLWLAVTYPETFGASWSTSPDPVDFRRFQLPDVYTQASMYRGVLVGSKERELPSYRLGGKELMTIRQENAMEEVLGPDNTSGQQWDSWMAVWGPRNEHGHPAALYEPQTGALDHAVAEQYRKYDIADLLRNNGAKYGLILKQRVRILVGDQDNYYLNEAVALLQKDLDKLSFFQFPEGQHGYIKILPGCDHGSIFMTPEMSAIPADMLDHLNRNGHIPSAAPK